MSEGTKRASKAAPGKPLDMGYPAWSPRFWHGMRTGDWFRMLADHGFRVHPYRVPMAMAISTCSVFNSSMHLVQRLRHGRRIRETQIQQPPIFIIGHWRSGTTYLHELLVRDERFGYPTTYECFAPSHFLVSEWIIPRLIAFLLPKKRPMDNMGAGFGYPQEDEFALASLGCPTPYLRMAFPNDPPCYMELLDMQDVDEHVLARWKAEMFGFVQALTVAHGKTLVLKSPPHTGRIQVLAELFPGAKFIHLARNPEKLFASSRRLWATLYHVQGLQVPKFADLDEFIFESFERMYRGFESQRASFDSQHLYDLRYEDLVRDPVGHVAAIYEQLELGDFETVREALESCVRERSDYAPNRHSDLEPEIRRELRRRWSNYYHRYGYDTALAQT